jgi:hypothetical protein
MAILRAGQHPQRIANRRQLDDQGNIGTFIAPNSLLLLARKTAADTFGERIMDKKIAGLLGAAAALATMGSANATEATGNPSNPAATYRDLLNPVPDALAALKADDARRANESTAGAKVAQVTIGIGHHHHHHHHHHMVPRVHVRVAPRPHHHHHHHHHHHSSVYIGH